MIMKNKILPVLLSLTLLATGCKDQNLSESHESITESSMPAEKLEISGINHIGIREYTTLTCSFNGKIVSPQWTTSNKKIATISSKGMVKGLSIGDVTINANYNGLNASFDLSVTESWALASVVSRLSKTSYSMTVTGDGGLYDSMSSPTFSLDVYSNGIYYHSKNNVDFIENRGIGIYDKKMFGYTVKDSGEIDQAVIFRDQSGSLDSSFYGLSVLPSTYYQVDLREDNTYDMTSVSAGQYLQALYFLMATQFMSEDQSDFVTELKSTIASLTMEVKNEYSFVATLGFGKKTEDETDITTTVTLTFNTLPDVTCPLVDSYLKTNTPSYPEIYPEITKAYELAKNHNYTRDLGTYTDKDKNLKINIGNGLFTNDYVFIEFNPEYIEETKGSYTDNPLVSRGYIDIKGKKDYEDGSYAFTIGDGKVQLGTRVLNNLGKAYQHWYDFYENLTMILDMLKPDFYTFDRIKTENSIGGNEFGSYSSIGASITSELFSDYLQMIDGMTSAGMLLSIDLSETNPSSSIINIGGLFSYNSNLAYQYDSYPYTNFNKTSSPLMDSFLSSLTDC